MAIARRKSRYWLCRLFYRMRYKEFVEQIRSSGLSYLDNIPDEVLDHLYLPIDELDQLLNDALIGTALKNMPLRTRSKFLNEKICTALGYTSPSSFKKSKPRFVGQNLDKYIQKANNLQIWNDEIDPDRR